MTMIQINQLSVAFFVFNPHCYIRVGLISAIANTTPKAATTPSPDLSLLGAGNEVEFAEVR